MTAKLFLDDSYQQNFEAEITAVSSEGVQLDRTIFYATSGGQPGDIGNLVIANQNVPVLTTKKGEFSGEIWHVLAETGVSPSVGDKVRGTIDWQIRHRHMRMHTCLHLLCSLVAGDVTGGSVGADKGRLDFNIGPDAVDKDELALRLNNVISQDHPVGTEWITDDELIANPQLIRNMSVKPPMGSGKIRLVRIGTRENTIDLQPCGGTHVRSTGEIGTVAITKIENKGKQNRRISLAFV